MSLRKQVKEIRSGLIESFDRVRGDILFVFDTFKDLPARVAALEREVKGTHKHGVSGKQYPTLAGKVKAIQNHLGLEFQVEKRQVIPTKVVANKKKSEKK